MPLTEDIVINQEGMKVNCTIYTMKGEINITPLISRSVEIRGIIILFSRNVEDDSGCESYASSSDSEKEHFSNISRRKRHKKYRFDENDGGISIR